MPGTALSGAEKDIWVEFLKDMDATRRQRFAELLAKAPATDGTSAYTLADFRILTDSDDVRDTVKDVAGFRPGDVKYFM